MVEAKAYSTGSIVRVLTGAILIGNRATAFAQDAPDRSVIGKSYAESRKSARTPLVKEGEGAPNII